MLTQTAPVPVLQSVEGDASEPAPAPQPSPTPRPTRLARRQAQRRRRGRIVAGGVVAALVVAMTAAAGTVAAMSKTVTIAVDGATRQVTTLSGTVAGALAAAGLHVGEHDTLAPAGTSDISDGSRIVVLRGRLVTLTIDGAQRQFWTTATTVAGALAQLGRDPADYQLSADRSREIPLAGLDLTATTLHSVSLNEPDGTSAQLSTTATTVGALLRDQGITLAADEVVAPAVDTPLQDGTTVTVRRLPTVTVVRGGHQEKVITDAASVGDLLAAEGIPVTAATRVSPTPDTVVTPGLVVTVTVLPTVTVTVGTDAPVKVVSDNSTVAQLLGARNIVLSSTDRLSPAATTAVTDGMSVTVTRVVYTTTTKDIPIAQPADVTRYSGSLDAGNQDITPGHPGTERVTYRTETINGVAGAPVETGRTVLVAATATVTVIGTRVRVTSTPAPPPAAPPAPPSTSPSPAPAPSASGGVTWIGSRVFFNDFSYGVNWDGLAKCESTNNPRAVNPSGKYFGLFQFDLRTWRSVGGSGNPIDASPQEQLLRAKKLYLSRGLQPWACAWAARM